MTLVEHFTRLVQYTKWGDDLCIDALSKLEQPPAEAVRQLSHSIVGRTLWCDRVNSRKTVYPLWEPLPLAQLKPLSDDNIANWQNVLAKRQDADLQETFSYVNTSGVAFTSSLYDMITQALNHSTHHRSQVALILRQNGIAPPVTDYIFYIRELEKKKNA